jgi:hypothetical protein
MLRDIVILAIGAFFGLGATVAGVAAPGLFPNTPSWIWYWAFWGGICLMSIMAIDAVWLLSWHLRPVSAVIVNIGLALLAWAAIAQFSPYYWETKRRDISKDAELLKPVVESLRQTQNALQGQQAAEQIVRQIIDQYDQLQRGSDIFEQSASSPAGTQRATIDRLASAQNTIENIRALTGNVRVQVAQLGGALIIKTAPNTYRITFPVPMRIAPAVTFGGLPAGTTANIIEKSNVGFTVIFTPPNITVDLFNILGAPSIMGRP